MCRTVTICAVASVQWQQVESDARGKDSYHKHVDDSPPRCIKTAVNPISEIEIASAAEPTNSRLLNDCGSGGDASPSPCGSAGDGQPWIKHKLGFWRTHNNWKFIICKINYHVLSKCTRTCFHRFTEDYFDLLSSSCNRFFIVWGSIFQSRAK